jgi:hypothetical protein
VVTLIAILKAKLERNFVQLSSQVAGNSIMQDWHEYCRETAHHFAAKLSFFAIKELTNESLSSSCEIYNANCSRIDNGFIRECASTDQAWSACYPRGTEHLEATSTKWAL